VPCASNWNLTGSNDTGQKRSGNENGVLPCENDTGGMPAN